MKQSYTWVFVVWQQVPFTVSPPATVRYFLFIFSLEYYFRIISSFLPNTQPWFCMSTFQPLLSVRSMCLTHRWWESAEALRLAADSQSMLSDFHVPE